MDDGSLASLMSQSAGLIYFPNFMLRLSRYGEAFRGESLKKVYPSDNMMILSKILKISEDGEWIVVKIAIPRFAYSFISLTI